jgi:hypothetical protein
MQSRKLMVVLLVESRFRLALSDGVLQYNLYIVALCSVSRFIIYSDHAVCLFYSLVVFINPFKACSIPAAVGLSAGFDQHFSMKLHTAGGITTSAGHRGRTPLPSWMTTLASEST